jgi:hypothetical protein
VACPRRARPRIPDRRWGDIPDRRQGDVLWTSYCQERCLPAERIVQVCGCLVLRLRNSMGRVVVPSHLCTDRQWMGLAPYRRRCAPGPDGENVAMPIQDWSGFGQAVGASSGALVGLLFVAVSLNRDRVTETRSLRASASQTLVLFMLPLVVSILLLTPGQTKWVLGTELTSLAVIGGLILAIAGRGKQTPTSEEE